MKNFTGFIYDFETLSTDPNTAPILSMGAATFETVRFTAAPYTYDELVDNIVSFYKFDVVDQVSNHGRVINEDTLEWWKGQDPTIIEKQLTPQDDDLKIDTLSQIFEDNYEEGSFVFTRGNTFDPIITTSILGKDPYPFWSVRDTRSFIDGLMWGADLRNDFTPPDVPMPPQKHDPVVDVALDILRMQYVVQQL